jgi:rhodanese-related sulfurtransferase
LGRGFGLAAAPNRQYRHGRGDRGFPHRPSRAPRLGRVLLPLDSANPNQRRRYQDYIAARLPRTRAPQGPKRTLFAPDLIGSSAEILTALARDPVVAAAREFRVELPYIPPEVASLWHEGALLLDVRSPAGRAKAGEVQGAVNVPKGDVVALVTRRLAGHAGAEVLLCGSVAGSGPLVETPRAAGHEKVGDVEGGFGGDRGFRGHATAGLRVDSGPWGRIGQDPSFQ